MKVLPLVILMVYLLSWNSLALFWIPTEEIQYGMYILEVYPVSEGHSRFSSVVMPIWLVRECSYTVDNPGISFSIVKLVFSYFTTKLYKNVEKPLFSIGLISFGADQFSSCALFQSEIASLHVSFTAYEYCYKLSKKSIVLSMVTSSSDPKEPVIHNHTYELTHCVPKDKNT